MGRSRVATRSRRESTAGRRFLRDHPYRESHERSVAVKVDSIRLPPSSLSGLLHWAANEWAREAPWAVTRSGVWASRPSRDENVPESELGGSLLGSPRDDDEFRRYIEASPWEAHYGLVDGHQVVQDGKAYERPMHAALARLHGPRWAEPYTAAAHRISALVFVGFDLGALVGRVIWTHDDCAKRLLPLPPYDAELWWRSALLLWWQRYEDGPRRLAT
jgi:hypothetical protein